MCGNSLHDIGLPDGCHEADPGALGEYRGNPTSGTAPLVIDCLKIDNAFEGLWDRIDATDTLEIFT